MSKRSILVLMLFIVTLTACSNESNLQNDSTDETELTISAASSLGDALTEINNEFENKHKHITVLLNLGGTGALQQQIIQGAPADLFFSASKDQFDQLVKKGFINEEKSTNLLGNQLVLITQKNKSNLNSFADLESDSVRKLSIGTPETVPAGMYARQALESMDLWDKLQKKLIPAKDVRQVLTYVETGNVDAGVVYKTDARSSDKVRIVAKAKPNSHQPIIYPTGILESTKHFKEANLFFEFLRSPQAVAIFEKYGFSVLD